MSNNTMQFVVLAVIVAMCFFGCSLYKAEDKIVQIEAQLDSITISTNQYIGGTAMNPSTPLTIDNAKSVRGTRSPSTTLTIEGNGTIEDGKGFSCPFCGYNLWDIKTNTCAKCGKKLTKPMTTEELLMRIADDIREIKERMEGK